MLTGNKDTDYIILSKTEDVDLLSYCKTNKLAQKICNNDNFWKQRFQDKYGDYIKKNENRSWKDFYLGVIYYNKYPLYEACDKIREHGDSHEDFLIFFESFKTLRGFALPAKLKKPLIDFFQNANFVIKNDLIHKLIDPLLNKGYLNRNLLTRLFTIYVFNNLNFSKNGRIYYKVDNLINLYLDSYLTELENAGNFDRNKFIFPRLQSILEKGIDKMIKKKLDDYQLNYQLNYASRELEKLK